MNCQERIEKIKAMPKGPGYYFAAACHNFLVEIERNGEYIFLTRREAQVHQQGIKDYFGVKTTLNNTILSL